LLDFNEFDGFGGVNKKVTTLMNKTMSNMNFSLYEKKDFFKKDELSSSKRSNKFLRKEKKLLVNRNKTPIGYNSSYYGFKESLTENYSNYNYTTQNNFYNKDKDYNSNKNSLIRKRNKS